MADVVAVRWHIVQFVLNDGKQSAWHKLWLQEWRSLNNKNYWKNQEH